LFSFFRKKIISRKKRGLLRCKNITKKSNKFVSASKKIVSASNFSFFEADTNGFYDFIGKKRANLFCRFTRFLFFATLFVFSMIEN